MLPAMRAVSGGPSVASMGRQSMTEQFESKPHPEEATSCKPLFVTQWFHVSHGFQSPDPTFLALDVQDPLLALGGPLE